MRIIRRIVATEIPSHSLSLAPTLAVFGTASDVGKSLITAGLCRILSDEGVRVAPYKAQNMSNNSGVTLEGGEMGRAQMVQARAARVEPHVDMNPVLLKPSSEDGSQVVLLGKVVGQRDAQAYFSGLGPLRDAAYGALERLRREYECVVIEGAGSCAEVNLRAREYVNFPCAHFADSRVVLVADIDRGGVFAQVVGSLEVMPPEDRARVAGVIINRFRGDRSLFDDGVTYLEERTGLPVFGVVPYLMGLSIESEDSLQMQAQVDPPESKREHGKGGAVRIAVLRLPHISNSTDFDALEGLEGVELHFLYRPRELGAYDLVILPGTKNVRHDLAWLHQVGWATRIEKYEAAGGRLGGICGGYQMMGESLSDPEGIEGPPGTSRGFGFLPIETTLKSSKVLSRTQGIWKRYGAAVSGYEIHVGETIAREDNLDFALEKRLRSSGQEQEGASRDAGRLWGTYLHGLFDSRELLVALFSDLRPKGSGQWQEIVSARDLSRERHLDDFANLLRENLKLDDLFGDLGLTSAPKI